MKTTKKDKEKEQMKKDWPIGMRVIVSGGNLYTMGTVCTYGLEHGEPWALTDDGVHWSTCDVSIRIPKECDSELVKKHEANRKHELELERIQLLSEKWKLKEEVRASVWTDAQYEELFKAMRKDGTGLTYGQESFIKRVRK